MPSPFPGMDPFLEEPTEWSGVHSRLINSISELLADRISPRFFVKIEERVYIAEAGDMTQQLIVPDVYIVEGRRGAAITPAAEITTPTLIAPLEELEIRDRYLEIHDTRTREVVTTIELLSPFNKAPGTSGREAFMRKRQAVMASAAHWIEIDLLRAGERPREVRGASDYYALLKRGGTSGPFEVWYSDVRDALPVIGVPLRSPFEDAALDLQAVFETMYRRAHYADSIDYTQRIPGPPLPPADQQWAAGRIQTWSDVQRS